MGPGLPPQVQALIVERIGSVVQLEVLLLLFAEPRPSMSAADVAAQLRIDPNGAGLQLEELTSHGLLLRTEGPPVTYRYATGSPHDAAVAALSHAYADLRVSVISLIYSKPSDTLKTFADAFRIRKEKD